MKLGDIFTEETMVVDLKAVTKAEALQELVTVLQKTRRLTKANAPEVLKALERRETVGSTGIGRGVGVPHVKHPSAAKLMGALGRSARGIEFQALDGAPVHLVFLLISPPDMVQDHLHALKKISAIAAHEDFRRFLRNARSAKEMAELMLEADERLQV